MRVLKSAGGSAPSSRFAERSGAIAIRRRPSSEAGKAQFGSEPFSGAFTADAPRYAGFPLMDLSRIDCIFFSLTEVNVLGQAKQCRAS
jgi:hypothetical protein